MNRPLYDILRERAFAAAEDVVRGMADAAEARRHDRIRLQRTARSVDLHVLPEAEDVAQQQLFMGERGLQLRDLDRAVADPGLLRRDARRRRVVEAAEGRVVAFAAMVEARDVRGALHELPRAIAGRAGYTGFAIPCNGDNRCVISLEQDSAGAQSNHQVSNEFDIYFANDQVGADVWSGLQQLRNLFPVPPVVSAR